MGEESARRTQIRWAHIGLEDREECGRVSQEQALAVIEPQQIRVPVFGSTWAAPRFPDS
jgi:hypothetical protein